MHLLVDVELNSHAVVLEKRLSFSAYLAREKSNKNIQYNRKVHNLTSTTVTINQSEKFNLLD